ncbi:MAG: hypothetical protein Q9168_002556 [Polycauliona sp. 1 TL-2023]
MSSSEQYAATGDTGSGGKAFSLGSPRLKTHMLTGTDEPTAPPTTPPAVSDESRTTAENVTQSNDPSAAHADNLTASDRDEQMLQRLREGMDEDLTPDQRDKMLKLLKLRNDIAAGKTELREVNEKRDAVKKQYEDSVARLRQTQDDHFTQMAAREELSESEKANIEVLRCATAAVTSDDIVEEEFQRRGTSALSPAPEWFTDKEKEMLKARYEESEAFFQASRAEVQQRRQEGRDRELQQRQEQRRQQREQRQQQREQQRQRDVSDDPEA